MAEINSVADMQIVVDAQVDGAMKALTGLEGIINRMAADGTQKLGFFESKLGVLGQAALPLIANFGAVGTAVQTVMGAVSRAMPQLETWAERLGAGAQLAEVKTAADDLAAAVGATFQDIMSQGRDSILAFVASAAGGPADAKAFEAWLERVKDKTVTLIQALQGIVESVRAPENRSLVALEAQLRSLGIQIADIDAKLKSVEAGDWSAKLMGPEWPAYLERRRQALLEQQQLLERLRAEKTAGIDLGEITISVTAIEQATEAIEKQNAELRIRIATLGMSAGAAAEYTMTQRAMNAAGQAWNAVSEEDKAKLFERARLTRVLTDELEAQRQAERAAKEAERKDQRFDRDIASAERELGVLMRRTEALKMTAGEAARLNAEEKLLAQVRAHGIPLDEDRLTQIRAIAAAYGEATTAAAAMQRSMQGLQEVGRATAGGLEQAFAQFLRTWKIDWRATIADFAADIAKLQFRQLITGPLFGSGGSGLGLFGQLFGFGGGRASGGPVEAGMAYRWQEKGQEFFMPGVDGAVVTREQLDAAMSAAAAAGQPAQASGPVTIRMQLDLTGANGDETIARISGQAATMAAQRAIQESDARFPARQRQLEMLGT